MKRACSVQNTNTLVFGNMLVLCLPAGRHPTLKKKLITDEKES